MGKIIIVPPQVVVTTQTSLLDIFTPAKLYRFVKEYIAHKWDKADIILLTQTCVAFYNLRYSIEGMIDQLNLLTFPPAEKALVYAIDFKQPWGQNITRFRKINCPDITKLSIHVSANPNESSSVVRRLRLLEKLTTLSLYFPTNMDSDTVKNYLAKLFFEIPLATLTTLHVESSQLKSLPSWIEKLTNLQTLNLTGCVSLTTLPDEIGKLPLQTINLSQCYALNEISRPIAQFHGLEVLILRNNQFTMPLPFITSTTKSLEIIGLKYDLAITVMLPTLSAPNLKITMIYPPPLNSPLSAETITTQENSARLPAIDRYDRQRPRSKSTETELIAQKIRPEPMRPYGPRSAPLSEMRYRPKHSEKGIPIPLPSAYSSKISDQDSSSSNDTISTATTGSEQHWETPKNIVSVSQTTDLKVQSSIDLEWLIRAVAEGKSSELKDEYPAELIAELDEKAREISALFKKVGIYKQDNT